MNLPDYFLADLPPAAALTPALIAEACQTLKRNRAHFLADRSTRQVIELLSHVAAEWLRADNPFRQLALEQGPAKTGFAPATLARGLDSFFGSVTRAQLEALVEQDLGEGRRLDATTAGSGEAGARRAAMACGPELLVHITAGRLPTPTFHSMVLGLLTRSAQFVKCASGAAFLPRLFAHSIYDCDRKVGACLEVAEWRGGNTALEEVLFAEAACVTVTGRDETLAAIRARLPPGTRFLGYGQRVSFAYVAGEALSGRQALHLAAAAAQDVVAWNQLGCLSPHVIYVQNGGEVGPRHFARLLAEELARREAVEPRGELSAEEAAGIASRRALYEVRAAHSAETQVWGSPASTAWTVVYEADARFQISCLNRFIYVKAVSHLAQALHAAEMVRGKVSTVGLAAPAAQAEQLVRQLARWGVTRVCPLGRMQAPPLAWRHDGRPALGDLVTWTDWERD